MPRTSNDPDIAEFMENFLMMQVGDVLAWDIPNLRSAAQSCRQYAAAKNWEIGISQRAEHPTALTSGRITVWRDS